MTGKKHPRPGRPAAVHPALVRSGEPFDGHHVLEEIRNPLGALLWQTLRDLVTWAATSPDLRTKLFDSAAHSRRLAMLARSRIGGRLESSLTTLSRVLLTSEQPDASMLAKAARQVSVWADEHTYTKSAIWFAQAAALLTPENAQHAYHAGLLCRKHAEYAHAETWFYRAIGLSRKKRDAQTYGAAYLSLGNLILQRTGDYARARRAFERALRISRRAGIRPLRAEALQDLFTVAVETRQVTRAEALAQQTFKAYKPSHPRLPALAFDVAVFWMLQGSFQRALPVFQAVSAIVTRPEDRLLALSSVARAAGGAGRLDVFARAWVDTWQLIDGRPTLECVPSSLLRLAYGSAYIGDMERLNLTTQFALALCSERGEEAVRKEVEELLRAVENQQVVMSVIRPADSQEISEAAERLADELVQKLAGCAGGIDHPRIRC